MRDWVMGNGLTSEKSTMSVKDAQSDLRRIQGELKELHTRISELQRSAERIAIYVEMARLYGEDCSKPSRASSLALPTAKLPPSVQTALIVLRERRRPTPTKILVDELALRGIHIGGKIPVTNLSSSLSRFKGLFRPDRSEGWSLLEWESVGPENKPPEDTEIELECLSV